MKPTHRKTTVCLTGAFALALTFASSMRAQSAPTSDPNNPVPTTATAVPDASTVNNGQAPNNTPVKLSPFEVRSDSNTGYSATTTTSTARIVQAYIDVPQTVNVITSEFIDDHQFQNVRDLYNWIPNLIVPQNDSNTFEIRGLNVGFTYIDGVQSGSYNSLPLQFFDRVEVVKGPSSAAFGVGQPGGIINYSSKAPTGKDTTTVEVGVGLFSNYFANFDTQGHAANNAKLSYRLVGFYDKGDSEVHNEPHHGEGGLLALRYEATPTLDLQLITSYSSTTASAGPDNTTGWANEAQYTGFTDIVSVGVIGQVFHELPGTNPTPGPNKPGLPGGTSSDHWAGGDLLGYDQQPLPDGWNSLTTNAFRENFIIDKSFADDHIHVRNTAVIENQQTETYLTQPTLVLLTNNDPTSSSYGPLYDMPAGVTGMEYARNYGRSDNNFRSDNIDIDAELDFGKFGKWTTLLGGNAISTLSSSYGYLSPDINPDGTINIINMYNINAAPAFVATSPITSPTGAVIQPYQNISSTSTRSFQNGVYVQEEAQFFDGILTLMAGWRRDWSLTSTHDAANHVYSRSGWNDSKGAPRYAISVKPTKWLSVYGLVTQHKDPTLGTPKYVLATRGDIQPSFIAQYNNFSTIEYYQPTGTLVESGVKGTFFNGAITASFCVFHETANGQVLGVGIPPTIDPDGSETQVIQNTIGGANSHGYEAEIFGRVTPRLYIIADWDFTTGSLTPQANPYFAFGSNNGQPQFVPNGITPPKTIMGHGKLDLGDLRGNGFYITAGAKVYSPYMLNWQYPIFEYYSNWQYTVDAGIGFRWDRGRNSIYANCDNLTNERVDLGIVQYYIMAPYRQGFITFKRTF